MTPNIRHYLVLCVTIYLCSATEVLSQNGSEVLENLKRYDSIYESGLTTSGTIKSEDNLCNLIPVEVQRNWRIAFDNNRCGYLMEVIEYEKPKFQEPKNNMGSLDENGWLLLAVRTKQWGYWGEDVSGNLYEDTNINVSPENEIVETGKMNNLIIYGPRDEGPIVPKRTILWSFGRFFSSIIDEITNVEKLQNGYLIISAIGKKNEGQSGRWEMEIEPAAAWMVRKARFYSDSQPDVINCEMINSGTTWNGSYCIPKNALFHYSGPVEGGNYKPKELTFDNKVEKFDEKLYLEAKESVTEKRPAKLTIHDYRVTPTQIYQPDRLKEIALSNDVALSELSKNSLQDLNKQNNLEETNKSQSVLPENKNNMNTKVTNSSTQSIPLSQIEQHPWYHLSNKGSIVILIIAGLCAACACVVIFGLRKN